MTMHPAIRVSNLNKKYIIGGQEKGYRTFREAVFDAVISPLQRLRSHPTQEEIEQKEFWALQDVSFDIPQGEVVGIIGRNGAGKSTLLKVLSKITEPTSGRVEIRGRVGSLLEVGTGFHPELTGRENIYMNGSILGMRRAEITRKFDEIVAFSEIEKFLDTPVKRYSSGMYVRLAFAVAAHLEPEILIVDEVLSVGDAQFQKKCLGKMEEVGKEGTTVLLVSHSMTTVQALANKAIFLNRGITCGITTVNEAVGKYLYNGEFGNSGYFMAQGNTNKDAYIVDARLINQNNEVADRFPVYESFTLEITWVNLKCVKVNPNFMLVNQNGINVMISSDTPLDWSGDKKKAAGKYTSKVVIPPNLLNANDYYVHISLDCSSPRICYDNHLDALRFSLFDPMNEKCLARGNFTHVREDVVLWPALEWSYNYERIAGE